MKTLLSTIVLTLMLVTPTLADRRHNPDFGYDAPRHSDRDHKHHTHKHRQKKHSDRRRHHKPYAPKHRQYGRKRAPYVFTPYYNYGRSGISIGGYVDDNGNWRTTWGFTFH